MKNEIHLSLLVCKNNIITTRHIFYASYHLIHGIMHQRCVSIELILEKNHAMNGLPLYQPTYCSNKWQSKTIETLENLKDSPTSDKKWIRERAHNNYIEQYHFMITNTHNCKSGNRDIRQEYEVVKSLQQIKTLAIVFSPFIDYRPHWYNMNPPAMFGYVWGWGGMGIEPCLLKWDLCFPTKLNDVRRSLIVVYLSYWCKTARNININLKATSKGHCHFFEKKNRSHMFVWKSCKRRASKR